VKVIGLVGGFTWLSTLDYYRIINEEVAKRLGGRHAARIAMWSVDFEEHMAIQDGSGWAGVTEEVTDIGLRLKAAGADFLVFGANTLHRVADPVEAAVGLPLLHIADATAAALGARGLRTVGLLGTRTTMTGDFWVGRMAGRHGIRVLVPDEAGMDRLDDIIYHELAASRFVPESRRDCLRLIERLTATGAEAVVLGCTELQLLVRPGDTPALLFDTLELHARAAAERALAD
jgi:aspartate racemase